MIGQIEYKDIHSSVYGVYWKSGARPLMPPMVPKTVTSGASGVYDFGDNNYSPVKISGKIVFFPTDAIDRKQKAREVAAWLSSDKWEKLIFGDETDKFYYARTYEQIDLEALTTTGEANITFYCQPFAYMAIDTSADLTWEEADFPWITAIPWVMSEAYTFAVTGNTDCVFENPGTRKTYYKSPQGSKFDIVITGSFTTLTLELNGKTLNYTEAVSNGIVTIDNVNMEVDLNGTNKLSKVTGDLGEFLEAIPGSNTLVVSGTGLNISILIDLTPEWI